MAKKQQRVHDISLKDEFLLCRTLGHQWEEAGDVSDQFKSDPAFGVPYDTRCIRCGSAKRQVLNRYTGERNGATCYGYVEGYQHAKGELPDRNTLKAIAILRREKKERA